MDEFEIVVLVFSIIADIATVLAVIVAVFTLRKNNMQVLIDRLFEIMKQQQFCDILSILHEDNSEDGRISLFKILQQDKAIYLDNLFWALDAILVEFHNSKQVYYFFDNPIIKVIRGKTKIEQLIEDEYTKYQRFTMLYLALGKQENTK